jgi:NADH dehydrogenase FAD-containing subunit
MNDSKPTVVIVGAGFGGLRAARILRDSLGHIALIDRRNYQHSLRLSEFGTTEQQT